jgi:hypothetical protein
MLVSTSDLLGTAMTAAKVAAMEIDLVRSRTETTAQRAQPLDRAIAELTQALAETVIARQHAVNIDSITTREHDFGSECAAVEERITAAIAAFV